MTVKRRNHGRNKHGRGHVKRVRCVSTGKAIPKEQVVTKEKVSNNGGHLPTYSLAFRLVNLATSTHMHIPTRQHACSLYISKTTM
jgi:hypothetical protein